ncbi:YoaK family protein [Aspergillus nidulans FGSC A4]|uniref:DUF1275 domain protein n=1 Tax=Emericella nidulans (strain FGSC A4 / ATCC 38163 / CBS 112.46 / NRRL 194 / M139) TaxID=227321 RepID=C8VG01_EMENI|nr:hypothetical protein [Aspergillus nidulans FGSC A4]CBF81579.1 TPA: conserved hypothetical protein [Aspergillus nidulans FGSC A4]
MPHMFPAEETSPLLNPNPEARGSFNPRKSSYLQRLKRHLATEITPHGTDLVLLVCYLITGLLDSSAVFIWGSFVSMQTGNTVYLGLGLSGLDDSGKSQRWLKALISISSFCIGSLFFAALARIFRSSRERGALMLSFVLQMGCVAVAAGIVSFKTQPHAKTDRLGWWNSVPLALVAFQSAGQAVTSRVVGFSGLTSVVLTSVYCDLFSYLGGAGRGKMADELRRLGAVGGLMLGISLGGLWAKSEVGLMGALWTAVVLKGGIAVAWWCWKAEEGGLIVE